MEIVRDTASYPDLPAGAAVTIGAYDGLHIGHRAVIEQVKAIAVERGLASAVVTFDRHPASVVRPESAPQLLCDLDQKLELLESTGVDVAVVVTFDVARAAETAQDFVQDVLVDGLSARCVIVGSDFHFGKGREGNVALLESIGPVAGFDVLGVELVDTEGGTGGTGREKVSSTTIRSAIVAGDIDSANSMLGRHHQVRGVVERGDARGRELGFPTANVAVPGNILLPADGIYAGYLIAEDGSSKPSAISLGRRPTFYADADTSLLEAHVLDWSGDLYGQRVAVDFVARLRGEAKFDSVEDLVAQIAKDCDDARALLAGHKVSDTL